MKDFWKNKQFIWAVYALAAVGVSAQRLWLGKDGDGYTFYENYVIFKNSFPHFLQGLNPYATYFAEQWDVYKYSPAFALFMATGLHSVPAALTATLAFYLLGRIASTMQALANDHPAGLAAGTLSALVPHFDAFARTEWLVYGTGSVTDAARALLQAVIYVALLAAASTLDLQRREIESCASLRLLSWSLRSTATSTVRSLHQLEAGVAPGPRSSRGTTLSAHDQRMIRWHGTRCRARRART